jgi:hypothetical protein
VDLEAELALLTADGLTPMVRELLQDPDARARTWEVEQVGWVAVNPGTLGIYRVRGVAETGGGQRPFSLVFKAVADVDLPGFPDTGYMHAPPDWLLEARAVGFRLRPAQHIPGSVRPGALRGC